LLNLTGASEVKCQLGKKAMQNLSRTLNMATCQDTDAESCASTIDIVHEQSSLGGQQEGDRDDVCESDDEYPSWKTDDGAETMPPTLDGSFSSEMTQDGSFRMPQIQDIDAESGASTIDVVHEQSSLGGQQEGDRDRDEVCESDDEYSAWKTDDGESDGEVSLVTTDSWKTLPPTQDVSAVEIQNHNFIMMPMYPLLPVVVPGDVYRDSQAEQLMAYAAHLEHAAAVLRAAAAVAAAESTAGGACTMHFSTVGHAHQSAHEQREEISCEEIPVACNHTPRSDGVDMFEERVAMDTPLRTTVMLRNIPNNYTRDVLLHLIGNEGFSMSYDFMYLPMDFKKDANLGYAFLNLVNPEEALRFQSHFHGFNGWGSASEKVAEVSWAEPLQGLEAYIERYRNSPVMHPERPEDHKPLLFSQGQCVPFPKPTRQLRAPRWKLHRHS
jgi:hypothetical protein